jgi:hemerythrin-like metal-binding protein
MKWLNEYNIGVSTIDQQHKKLAASITGLQHALTTTYVNRQMAKTLKFLVDYTQHHFHEEEEVMQSVGFPDLEKHKQLHKDLVNDVRQILIRLKNKETIHAGDLIDFLIGWLQNHIIEEDQKIGRHIQRMKNKDLSSGKNISPETDQEKLIRKLGELREFNSQRLISTEDYTNKKSYLIVDFFELQQIETMPVLMNHFKLIDRLADQVLITQEEQMIFHRQLANKVNLKSILDSIKDKTKQLELLDFLLERRFISNEKFEIFKEQLL